MSSKKSRRRMPASAINAGRRRTPVETVGGRGVTSTASTVSQPASVERPSRRAQALQARRSGRQTSWQLWGSRLRTRAENVRLPTALDRLVGAEAPLWIVLLVVLPIIAIGLVLTVGLRLDAMPQVDYDYWWHLATGNWIIDHGRVPTTDPFSWTRGGEEWVAHEWLAALLFAVVDRLVGYSGGIILIVVVATAGFWRLVAGMRFYGLSRRFICILVLLWGGAFFRSGVMVVRPQVLTFALLAVLVTELAAYETGRRRVLWVVPPLFALWVNLNLTVLFGVLCLGAFVLDRLLKGRVDRHIVWVCTLSCLALLLNPRGPALLLTALKYRDPDAVYYQHVFEWMGPRLNDPTHLPFLLALPVIPLALWQLLRLRVWPALPVLILAYQSFSAIRFIPLFEMLAWLLGPGSSGRSRETAATSRRRSRP